MVDPLVIEVTRTTWSDWSTQERDQLFHGW